MSDLPEDEPIPRDFALQYDRRMKFQALANALDNASELLELHADYVLADCYAMNSGETVPPAVLEELEEMVNDIRAGCDLFNTFLSGHANPRMARYNERPGIVWEKSPLMEQFLEENPEYRQYSDKTQWPWLGSFTAEVQDGELVKPFIDHVQSIAEIRELMDENDRIDVIVPVELERIHGSLESFNEYIEEAIIGLDGLLHEISCEPVGAQNGDVLIRVQAQVEITGDYED